MANKPLKRIQIGFISASIWNNKTENGGNRYGVTIVRNYRIDEEWFESSTFDVDDLPIVEKVSDLALKAVMDLHEASQS